MTNLDLRDSLNETSYVLYLQPKYNEGCRLVSEELFQKVIEIMDMAAYYAEGGEKMIELGVKP